ncbi:MULTISPECIES: ribosome maturation factor RimM [unclassified Spirosoma]|uniref:ribosome maturation factor RimM n=1 Tax=unclassified Spirosoma TaxID=2621999 RepID=UPI000962F0D3|nr:MULTISPECIES: ribosome maturation factor RimM [unclassified Spirosoma]MBN8821067.1 16S rRNA processing protein RimM [Spirosoma sp.]OJW79293.1 MAG: 16S rRNA processing protein RimM [Spirosoma sp. 48-14]
MTKDDCYQVGHITKTHGVNGELVLFLDVDQPDEYADLESVLLDVKGELIPYFIESIAIVKGSRAIIAFEDVDTIEQAERLINCGAYLPLSELEPITDETRFYFHEIVGYQVVDAEAGELGIVQGVYAMNAQDLIAMDYQGKEVLIPINSDIVRSVDRASKKLNVVLPDGLLDIYMSESGKDTPETEGDTDDTDED